MDKDYEYIDRDSFIEERVVVHETVTVHNPPEDAVHPQNQYNYYREFNDSDDSETKRRKAAVNRYN